MRTLWDHFTTWMNSLELSTLFSPQELFKLVPPTEWKLMWIYVGFIGLSWIGALLIYFLPIHTSLKQRLAQLFWFNAILGIFLFFFRFESIPLLGMDAWRLVQEIATIVWLGSIVYFHQTSHKEELLAEQVAAYKKRYLPTSKKK